MKKGFTLIELLAVIVILAIIATIATPIVLSIIENAKESTTLRNAEYYLDAVEQSISRKSLNTGTAYQPLECEIQEDGNLLCDEEIEVIVEVKGKKPNGGTITFEKGKIKDITLNIENKTVTKNEKDEFVIGNDSVKTYKAVFADNTWAEIADACQNNAVPSTWNVGDKLVVPIDGVNYEVMIIGKNHDTYANGYTLDDGSNKAPLTFQVDVVAQRVMNTERTNAGGWAGSELYAYLHNDIYNALEFKEHIKPVVKSTNKGYVDSGNVYATESVDSNDKLFLLSSIEVFGSQGAAVYNLEGSQYDFYKNNKYDSSSRVQKYDETAVWWWLRTPFYDGQNGFNCVSSGGNSSVKTADSPSYISFAFCF